MQKVGTLLTVLFLFTALDARANLITNGSFETPVVPVGGFENFTTGSTSITGWTVVGPEASPVSTSFASLGITFNAEDGNQWLDLTGDVSNAVEGVQQTVTTTPGTTYALSFWVGNVDNPTGDPTHFYGTTSTVNVRLGGISGALLGSFENSTVPSPTTSQNWEQFTTLFTATGPSTIIDFLNGDPSTDNSNGLDNVDLELAPTTTPEPSSLLLLGSGLIGLAGFVRRLRR